MQALYTATATAVGGRNGSIKSSDGVLDLKLLYPKNWVVREVPRPIRNDYSPLATRLASRMRCCGSRASAKHLSMNPPLLLT